MFTVPFCVGVYRNKEEPELWDIRVDYDVFIFFRKSVVTHTKLTYQQVRETEVPFAKLCKAPDAPTPIRIME